MSLFDKDLIEREVIFDPDPLKNLPLQIRREFGRLYSQYENDRETSEVNQTAFIFIQNGMDRFLNELMFYGCEPKHWMGPLCTIYGYHISWDDNEFKVEYKPSMGITYQIITFRIS